MAGMKALSLYQPYAQFMAYGYKGIETRPWETSYRGPLAIAAAKKRDFGEELQAVCDVAVALGMTPIELYDIIGYPDDWPRGAPCASLVGM